MLTKLKQIISNIFSTTGEYAFLLLTTRYLLLILFIFSIQITNVNAGELVDYTWGIFKVDKNMTFDSIKDSANKYTDPNEYDKIINKIGGYSRNYDLTKDSGGGFSIGNGLGGDEFINDFSSFGGVKEWFNSYYEAFNRRTQLYGSLTRSAVGQSGEWITTWKRLTDLNEVNSCTMDAIDKLKLEKKRYEDALKLILLNPKTTAEAEDKADKFMEGEMKTGRRNYLLDVLLQTKPIEAYNKDSSRSDLLSIKELDKPLSEFDLTQDSFEKLPDEIKNVKPIDLLLNNTIADLKADGGSTYVEDKISKDYINEILSIINDKLVYFSGNQYKSSEAQLKENFSKNDPGKNGVILCENDAMDIYESRQINCGCAGSGSLSLLGDRVMKLVAKMSNFFDTFTSVSKLTGNFTSVKDELKKSRTKRKKMAGQDASDVNGDFSSFGENFKKNITEASEINIALNTEYMNCKLLKENTNNPECKASNLTTTRYDDIIGRGVQTVEEISFFNKWHGIGYTQADELIKITDGSPVLGYVLKDGSFGEIREYDSICIDDKSPIGVNQNGMLSWEKTKIHVCYPITNQSEEESKRNKEAHVSCEELKSGKKNDACIDITDSTLGKLVNICYQETKTKINIDPNILTDSKFIGFTNTEAGDIKKGDKYFTLDGYNMSSINSEDSSTISKNGYCNPLNNWFMGDNANQDGKIAELTKDQYAMRQYYIERGIIADIKGIEMKSKFANADRSGSSFRQMSQIIRDTRGRTGESNTTMKKVMKD